MNERLTTREYWEDYYQHDHADKKHIVTICSNYDTYWERLLSANSESKSIIEIGGYPGRYLAYLSDKYSLEPTCLDFNSDHAQIQRTFDIMGISNFHILEKDFNEYVPNKKYDYVISLGFIEHFENFNEILDKHVEYLKPGGKMLVMIPNMRYLRNIYAYFMDRDNLKAHNLKCMSLKTFEDFAIRNGLKIDCLEYRGGFPFGVHQKLNMLQKLIFKTTRLLFKYKINPYLEKHPTKYLSAGIIGIYEKPLS